MGSGEKKIYLLKYYFDSEDQSNYIAVKWQTGLKEFFILHNKEEVERVSSFEKMSKGIEVFLPNEGYVFIRVVQKPLGFEVKLGDRYLVNSRILSEEKMTSISSIFYFVGVITIITNLRIDVSENILISFLSNLPLLVGFFYLFAGWKIKKGFIWPYVLGVIFFILSAIIVLLIFGWYGIFFHVLRLVFLILMFSHFKYILDLYKHRKSIKELRGSGGSEDILDDF